MTNYITITAAQLYNNNGVKMEVLPKDTPFTTGDWVKDGKLYLGPAIPNRWIPVGTYEENETVPPPVDPPPPPSLPDGTIQQIRYSQDEGVTWTDWEYWRKYSD
jgi:hypothetical protein